MSVERAAPADPFIPSAVETLERVLARGMVNAFDALVADRVWSARLNSELHTIPGASERFVWLSQVAEEMAVVESVHGRGAALLPDDPFVVALVEHGHITRDEIAAARTRSKADA